LVLGQSWVIVNNSTGVVTVQSSGGNTITAMAAGTQITVTCISTSGTTAASWYSSYVESGGLVLPGTSGQIAYYAASGSIVSGSGLSALIDAALGSTQGDILYRNSTVWTVLGPGTASQVLQTGGASANPSWTTVSGVSAVPQVTVYTTGTGTYTVPAGTLYLEVELVGGGAGGQSFANATGTNTNPTAGGNTTFGTTFLEATGGGVNTANFVPGSPGVGSGGDINLTGNPGGLGQQNNGSANSGVTNSTAQLAGGTGGASYFGGAGQAGALGLGDGGNAATNSGSGGGGVSMNTTNQYISGAGGSAGGYCKKKITSSIQSTYAYAIGTAGAGGNNSGYTGGNGAAGIIVITAYFQ
jgi:hypothetical protein